jgi:hypothetical protein
MMRSLDSLVCRPDMSDPSNQLTGSQSYGAYVSIGIAGSTEQTAGLVASFYDQSRGNLVLATCEGSTIVYQTVDGEDAESGVDTGDVGLWSSLAIDPKGRNPAVAYLDQSLGILKFVQSLKGDLEVIVVDDGVRKNGATRHLVGQFASLQFDGTSGQPRIAYLDSTARAVRLAQRSEHGAWSSVLLAEMDEPGIGGIGLGLDLALDTQDRAWVVYGRWQLENEALDTMLELKVCTVGDTCGAGK